MGNYGIKKVTLSTQVIDSILSLIERGEWEPGKKLPNEIELAASFEVSRNIMREAMKVLESYGILDGKTGTGTFVSKSAYTSIYGLRFFDKLKNNKSIEKCLETRLIIEPELAYYAAIRSTPEQIAQLKLFVSSKKNALIGRDYIHDFDLHTYVAKCSQNDILETLLCSILSQLQVSEYGEFSYYSDSESLVKSADDHYHIVQAVENRNPLLAKEIMHRHLLSRITLINSAYNSELSRSKQKRPYGE